MFSSSILPGKSRRDMLARPGRMQRPRGDSPFDSCATAPDFVTLKADRNQDGYRWAKTGLLLYAGRGASFSQVFA
jgi:hypothetical protein